MVGSFGTGKETHGGDFDEIYGLPTEKMGRVAVVLVSVLALTV